MKHSDAIIPTISAGSAAGTLAQIAGMILEIGKEELPEAACGVAVVPGQNDLVWVVIGDQVVRVATAFGLDFVRLDEATSTLWSGRHDLGFNPINGESTTKLSLNSKSGQMKAALRRFLRKHVLPKTDRLLPDAPPPGIWDLEERHTEQAHFLRGLKALSDQFGAELTITEGGPYTYQAVLTLGRTAMTIDLASNRVSATVSGPMWVLDVLCTTELYNLANLRGGLPHANHVDESYSDEFGTDRGAAPDA